MLKEPGIRLTVYVNLCVSGPEDRVTLGLTTVSSQVLQVQIQQVEEGLSIWLLRPLQDSPVPVLPPPGECRRLRASRGSACQNQTRTLFSC